jgi:hypothetical protein
VACSWYLYFGVIDEFSRVYLGFVDHSALYTFKIRGLTINETVNYVSKITVYNIFKLFLN